MNVILASNSPRRRELLRRLVPHFQVAISGASEESEFSTPETVARELAERKARAVWNDQQIEAGLIIGADTIIDLDGEILGKPENALDAQTILGRLCGKRHQVITGLAIINSERNEVRTSSVATSVHMRGYSEKDIVEYVSSGEPMDKAGAYAIQGRGGALVSSIEGCYFNVVGFPLCEVARMLSDFPVRFSAPGPACILPGGEPCPREGRR